MRIAWIHNDSGKSAPSRRFCDRRSFAHRHLGIDAIAPFGSALNRGGRSCIPWNDDGTLAEETFRREIRNLLTNLTRDMVLILRDDAKGLDGNRVRDAEAAIGRLITRFGYARESVADMAGMLLRKRFHDLVV